MSSLFGDPEDDGMAPAEPAPAGGTPLAERMRPRTLDDIAGQEHILGPGTPLRLAIERDVLQSAILWGPPGTGKTTLARVTAHPTPSPSLPPAVFLECLEVGGEIAAGDFGRRPEQCSALGGSWVGVVGAA